MRFIQLTDEAGCEVWVNLDAVSKIVPAWHENGKPTALEISFDGGLAGVTVKDPAEIDRLKHILSLIAGDPAAKVERFQALRPAKGQEDEEAGDPGYCPDCGLYADAGHRPDCPRVAIRVLIQEAAIPPEGNISEETFSNIPINAPHDWRNYIPSRLQRAWGKLSEEVRLTAYFFAQRQANAEEWE